MNLGDPLDKYVCRVCGKPFVVPSLARECEDRHDLGIVR